MRGRTARTPELVQQAIKLRELGWTYKQIGGALGVSLQAAQEWINDPDGTKRDKRKENYRGTCLDCGAVTYSGDKIPPERCNPCANRLRVIWTRDAILTAIRAWANEHGGIPPSATDWNPSMARKHGHHDRVEKFYADNAWPHVNTVQEMFGSWNAGIRAAGLDPRPVGTYGREGEDPEFCREIAERYAAGESSYALAREYGCSESTINYRVRKAGGRLRSMSEAQRLRHSKAAA